MYNWLKKDKRETNQMFKGRSKEEARIKRFDNYTLTGIAILWIGLIIGIAR